MIESIETSVIWNGRKAGPTWWHPRPCRVPAPGGDEVLMTTQTVSGSDYFGPVHWSATRDGGRTWSDPAPIPGLGRRVLEDRLEEGVCDVVPEYHPATDTVLAVGHNVFYRDGKLARPARQRHPVYVVRDRSGTWSQPRKLEWNDPRAGGIYTCGCGQRVTLESGDVLMPISFGPMDRRDRGVSTLLCSFDDSELAVRQAGGELRLAVKRGLLEPSIVRWGGRFFMTIRAEDGHGYFSTSDDGLAWAPARPWEWDDGEAPAVSTTQQHWLDHSDGLWLVYTRRSEENVHVFRWRSPLYVARVDAESLRLVRSSERIVLPLIGDGVHDPDHVARMGNFHTLNASPTESWVTVGETLPNDGWKGDTLLARIRWS